MPPALWGVCAFRYLLLCVRYFNSRDHSWRDYVWVNNEIGCNISTHATTQGATIIPFVRHAVGKISTHAPTQGATSFFSLYSRSFAFQLTRPCKARRISAQAFESAGLNFNSRAHARRDCLNRHAYYSLLIISTHAPTQGATRSIPFITSSFVFQLTRPRKARLLLFLPLPRPLHFNSRAHARRDQLVRALLSATIYFNSRAHARRDLHP